MEQKNQAELSNMLFALNYNFYYRNLRMELLVNEYNKLETILYNLSSEQYDNIRQMIEIEIIVNAIQYCNELGAFAICVKKKKLNKLAYMLVNINDSDIKSFYEKVDSMDLADIKKYMGYQNICMSDKYIRSCERYQDVLKGLSNFYLLNYDLYLSYKHGLRINTFSGNDGTFVYFIPITEKENQFFTTGKKSVGYGLNKATIICDAIQNIFDRLYIPSIKKLIIEFLAIENIDNSVYISIESDKSLIPDPKFRFSIPNYRHPWLKLDNISPEPFY